jgi:hypothetical protein
MKDLLEWRNLSLRHTIPPLPTADPANLLGPLMMGHQCAAYNDDCATWLNLSSHLCARPFSRPLHDDSWSMIPFVDPSNE